MIAISLKGLEETFLKAETDLAKAQQEQLRKESYRLLNALKVATPRDTGKAAESWKISRRLRSYEIFNDVPYLPELNAGSSKQAPSHFIERTALRYGRPRGLLVVERDS